MKADKYTKDKLIAEIIDSNRKITEFTGKVASALDAINDSNILHKQSIEHIGEKTDENRAAIIEQAQAIKRLVEVNNKFLAIFRWMIITLVGAIIILAGAEKALKFFPKL